MNKIEEVKAYKVGNIRFETREKAEKHIKSVEFDE